ncbi:hypothetical protein ACFYN0_34840 [Streptomyces sp. NPDC006704]|uniref:hypothetical protein n=1 Tax=Streptomyces sp. NPDC006704 TaxID=3364760 RepID=UPI00368F14DB
MNDRPDVEIIGGVTKMTFQTDRQGAVLVAYTRNDDGTIGRAWLRLNGAGVDYIRRRLDDRVEIKRESDAAARAVEVQA